MHRSLARGNLRVNVYLSANSESVCLTIRSAEEPDVVSNIESLKVSTRTVSYTIFTDFNIHYYCILGIFTYLCSVYVKDSVSDVCITGGITLSIGSLV